MTPILALVGVASLVAALVWARSTRRLHVVWKRVEAERGPEADVTVLARSAFRKDLHTTCLYGVLAVAAGAVAVLGEERIPSLLFALILVPVALSVAFGRDFARNARLAEDRTKLERKAEEVLSQEELAPKRWAARLAPEELPDFAGFELGRVYQAGTGVMAGDFYDVFRVAPSRIAAVIGDVTGRGIDASITAFQAKYLLRVFLRQYRDPAQALEELNTQMAAPERTEEFISLVVVVFDTDAGTLRFASAGHPAAWLWHDREVRPLRSTGPLLMLDPNGHYHSREIPLNAGDLLLLYTDGLAEVRNGEQMFGEERIANSLRRDPNVAAGVLCKNLLEAARDFASETMGDDVAILAIRRA
jgi:serine phosphatase RsbU (regulator of sigma subunit)